MAAVALRRSSPDAEPGRSLLAEFADEIAALYPGWDPSRGPTATPEEISPPSGRFLVAYLGDRPVGCGALKRLDASTAEVKRIFVRPDARGAGVARALLDALEEAARAAGYARVRLDTGDRLPRAEALFRSSGYREIPDYNGNPYAALWFEKLL